MKVMETLRKFGLEYCDVGTMLWNVSVMLRPLILNVDIRNKKPIPLILYIVAVSVALGYFYVYVVSLIWFCFIRCPATGDLLAAIIVFSLGVSSEIGTVKLVYMFMHIEKVRDIVSKCLACDSSVVPGSRFSNNLLITLRQVKKRAMMFWLVIIGNGVVYVLMPLLLPGRHFTEDMFILFAIPLIFYIVAVSVAVGYFYVYVVSLIWFCFIRCPATGDLLAAIIVFSLGVSSEIGTVKLVYMFMHIGTVREIVSECLACDSAVVPGSRFSTNLLITLRQVKKRAMMFWLVIIGNGVVYVLKPMLLPGRHFTEDMFILLGLEPMEQNPNYQIATILFFLATIFTVYLPANMTAFLIVVTGYIEAQMLSLSEELIHLWEDAEEHYYKTNQDISILDKNKKESDRKKKTMNYYVEIHLKEIIAAHGRNINCLHQVENVFSGAIALEFFLLVISLIAELLGGLGNTYMEIPFALMQVGMDCYTGQQIMDASVKFERAVYDSKWENYNISSMKIILMMLQSSQKTMMLSAGGLIMLSFSCLMQIFRSIYSTYTTLSATIK